MTTAASVCLQKRTRAFSRAWFLGALVFLMLVRGGTIGAAETTFELKIDNELTPTDFERVKVGEPAPDFTLADENGTPVTLSQFRGQKSVVLVFYRGHW
jgi:cytochrome oxidase Cu insertion factor (SCO1/SenC/PrrC family)